MHEVCVFRSCDFYRCVDVLPPGGEILFTRLKSAFIFSLKTGRKSLQNSEENRKINQKNLCSAVLLIRKLLNSIDSR